MWILVSESSEDESDFDDDANAEASEEDVSDEHEGEEKVWHLAH